MMDRYRMRHQANRLMVRHLLSPLRRNDPGRWRLEDLREARLMRGEHGWVFETSLVDRLRSQRWSRVQDDSPAPLAVALSARLPRHLPPQLSPKDLRCPHP